MFSSFHISFNRLLESVSVCNKVIQLSGVYCIDFLGHWTEMHKFKNLQWKLTLDIYEYAVRKIWSSNYWILFITGHLIKFHTKQLPSSKMTWEFSIGYPSFNFFKFLLCNQNTFNEVQSNLCTTTTLVPDKIEIKTGRCLIKPAVIKR